jgi:hypothetical protein
MTILMSLAPSFARLWPLCHGQPLYASATGTCVLQLTDPPGELGHDDAPSKLVSESTPPTM